MKVAFFVNSLEGELGLYTTTQLALSALKAGHEIFYITVEDFAFAPDGRVIARAARVPERSYQDGDALLGALREDVKPGRIDVAELDVLMLRNDPSEDQIIRPWAQSTGILFGHAAALQGVVVVNDPRGLSLALNKLYLSHFPRDIRPDTLVSRDPVELAGFVHAHHETGTILKPLQGSGGESVFFVEERDTANLQQILDSVRRFGYVIAQEYLSAVSDRDTRIFLLDGEPLRVNGHYCAVSRTCPEGEIRTNTKVGGKVQRAEVTEPMLEIARRVRPRLVRDGMFLVGLDLVGDQILEINVFSPGGMASAMHFEEEDFTRPVLDALEERVRNGRRGSGSGRRGSDRQSEVAVCTEEPERVFG